MSSNPHRRSGPAPGRSVRISGQRRSGAKQTCVARNAAYVFTVVLFPLLISAWVNLQLFQDGSSYLLELLTSRSAVRHERISVFLIQAPVILASKSLTKMQIDPVVNLQVMRFVFSLGYSLVPFFSLALCWLVLRRRSQDLLVWAVLSILFINLVNFSWVSELLISLQLSFPLFLAAIIIPGSRLQALLSAALLPAIIFLHPLVAFPLFTITVGCIYVAAKSAAEPRALLASAVVFAVAAGVRIILNFMTLTEYESSFFNTSGMTFYLAAASLENKLFLATCVVIGASCALANSHLVTKPGAMILILFMIAAQVFAVVLTLLNLSVPLLVALLLAAGCFGIGAAYYRSDPCRTTADGKIRMIYVACITSALVSSGLLVSQYFAVDRTFQLKTGLTVLVSSLIMLMAAFSSVGGDTGIQRQYRFRLTVALCIAFAAVTGVKSLIWYSAVQSLKEALLAVNARCAETRSPEFTWIRNTPYSILDNWSLPSLALVVQDTRPRKLLLAESNCRRFYDSGLVQIDPWTNISAKKLSPALY